MTQLYILQDGIPIPEPDLIKWARWFGETDNRVVAVTEKDGITVSTIFLGLDHNFTRTGLPLLYETMVFGGPHDQEMERYATREEAIAGHERMVKHCLSDSPSPA